MATPRLILADGDEGILWIPVAGQRSAVSRTQRLGLPIDLNRVRFGTGDGMTGWKRRPSYNKHDRIEYEDGKDYSARELEQLADQFLRDDARTVDPETGKERGIGGKDPILFAEHLYQRQKREILNENGVPEPGLVSGMYYRAHPEGRKINSEEQRKKHGASYYR